MKRPLQITGLLLVLGIAGLFGYQKFFVSEEAKIAKQLDDLIEVFEQNGKESILISATRAKKVLTFFAPEFVANLGPEFGRVENNQEFVGTIAAFRSRTSSLRISTMNRDIRTRNNDADILTTMEANYNGAGQNGRVNRKFQITMKRIDGEWLITRVEVLDE